MLYSEQNAWSSTVNQLKKNCADCQKPDHDDFFYLRWLLARDFDIEAAEKMLRDSLKWREEWLVDTLLSWKVPEPVDIYYPSGVSGYDKEGAPVVIIPFAGLDMWGMLHTIRKSDFIRLTLQKIEYFKTICDEQVKKHGNQAARVNLIVDMENFNIRQYTWRPAGEVIVTLVQMYEANYPEVLKTCFIVNAPRIFTFAFSIIKKFMKEYTLQKIQIFKSEPEKWQPLLREFIDADQLPKHYGGTMVDTDGNPKCPSKINHGGTVPKSLFFKKSDKSSSGEKYTQVTVKKGEKFEIPLITTDDGTVLRWEFKTESHDIKFGVNYTDLDGNETEAVPLQRVSCSSTVESGEIACKTPATYTITFDNTYSFLRSKVLHYSVNLKGPENSDAEVNGTPEITENIKSIALSTT